MKIIIVFLVLFLSFSDEREITRNSALLKEIAIPTALVGMNVTWSFTSGINVTNVTIIVKRLDAGEWAAFGCGEHVAMGETHVFMCKRLVNDTVVINRYANPGNHTPPQPAGTEQGGLFTPLASQFLDGIVTCQFSLSNFTSQTLTQLQVLNPLSQSGTYHPIFAVGKLDANNNPQQHDGFSRDPKLETVQLNQNENILYKF